MGKEDARVGGSEQPTTSQSPDFTKMMTGMMDLTVPQMKSIMEDIMDKKIREIVPQVMRPVIDDFQAKILDSVRKIVKEEIRSAKDETLAGGNWTNTNASLKFLDEVSDVVLTGKEIKGKGGDPVRLSVVDETGQVIENGQESSAKVEILLLEASERDTEHNWSHEEFNSRIINESDKTKPHLAKNYRLYLDKGVGMLTNAKLANASDWTKSCKCRLGARVLESLSGTKVQEAWTKAFVVSDSRGKLYGKHYPPSLHDSVWRLIQIGKGGEPCKRLKENNVSTVQDFLFLLSVDPPRLEKIIGAGATDWKNIKEHARSCIIDDKSVREYTNSAECNMSVVFDVVGQLKGVIHNSQYVLNKYLSEADKVSARRLLCSAFENQGSIIHHRDEMTFLQKFRCQASNASPNASIQEGVLAGCCNPPTVDSSQKAEAPKLLASSYQDVEVANYIDENCPEEWLVPNCQDSDFFEKNLVENTFAACPYSHFSLDSEPSLLGVNDAISRFYGAEWECDVPVFKPNSDQEQRAGTRGGNGSSEGSLSRVPDGNHDPLLPHIDRRKRRRN